MTKIKLRKVNIYNYLLQINIITLIFLIISLLIINTINKSYYNHIENQSLNMAKSYMHSLSKATEAKEVINELLEHRLNASMKAAAVYDGNYNNELLKELAENFEVDEIDYYNSEGELIYSNMPELVGWKTHIGHPVHNFMIGINESFVGEIRQDSITKEYFKYAYFKVSNGGFIQIGVKADKVHNLLRKFELHTLIEEIYDFGTANNILFIDNNYIFIESKGDNQSISEAIKDIKVKESILENQTYGFMYDNHKGEEEYIVFVPVFFQNSKLGTLAISQPLKEIKILINQFTAIIITALVITYILLAYTVFLSYKKDKKLVKAAYYDTLTSLPNVQYLREMFNENLKKSNLNNKAALFLVNCRNFRILNLLYGYEFGDNTIVEISKVFVEIAEEIDNISIYRFSVDRFIFYVNNYINDWELDNIIDSINKKFDSEIKVNDIDITLNIQIGIVKIDNEHSYDNFEQVLKDATISLNQLNYNELVNYAYYNVFMENELKREEIIYRDIKTVLADENSKMFYLEYHPLIDIKTNKIIGFEALSRLKSEELGQISPIEFIDVAEKKQIIVPLGELILKQVCVFLSKLKTEGFNDIKIAINVSGIQILRDDFIDIIVDLINKSNVDNFNIELEITESIFLDDFEVVNEKLKILRDSKIRIAIDDFGTGYSSLSRLRDLNVDSIKVDQYFISNITDNQSKNLIISDIISMAHKVGLEVVAEGIEDENQLDYLKIWNCDIGQGYYFSKPLSEEKALEMLKNRKL